MNPFLTKIGDKGKHVQPCTKPIDTRLVRSSNPARLDGNNVSVDQELGKLLENRTMYEVGMELMDRWGSLKKIAREVR